MQQTQQVLAKVLIELSPIFIHRLANNARADFDSGIFRIATIENPDKSTTTFINMNSFYYVVGANTIFVRVEHDSTISYLFERLQEGFLSITLEKIQPFVANLEDVFRNISCLIDYSQAIAIPELKTKLKEHCQSVSSFPLLMNGKALRCLNTTGVLVYRGLRLLGRCLSFGITKCTDCIANRIQEKKESPFSEESKRKFGELKQGTQKIFKVSSELVSSIMDPVFETGKKKCQKLNQKITNSQSPKLKYVANIGKSTIKIVGNAVVALAHSAVDVGTALGKGVQKIWDKKYGHNTAFVQKEVDIKAEEEYKQNQTTSEKVNEKNESLEAPLSESKIMKYPLLEEIKETRDRFQ